MDYLFCRLGIQMDSLSFLAGVAIAIPIRFDNFFTPHVLIENVPFLGAIIMLGHLCVLRAPERTEGNFSFHSQLIAMLKRGLQRCGAGETGLLIMKKKKTQVKGRHGRLQDLTKFTNGPVRKV